MVADLLDVPRSPTSPAQQEPAVTLYVGGHHHSVQGERMDLGGERMFSAAHPPGPWVFAAPVAALIDSGAFTDPPQRRLDPERALARQLRWEARAATKWGFDFRARGLVSYDLLIDESWVAGRKCKRRWTVRRADAAVRATVEAAHYLAAQRTRLAPRLLVLSCQGVDAVQYEECATEILRVARPGDWFGLGGWCILGRMRSYLPIFFQSLHRVLPRVARAGLRHVHIFGVLLRDALGPLVWLADRHRLAVSTDSSAPVLACTWPDAKRAGVRRPYWRDNVAYWRTTLAGLRTSPYYRRPPDGPAARQLALEWGDEQEGGDHSAVR